MLQRGEHCISLSETGYRMARVYISTRGKEKFNFALRGKNFYEVLRKANNFFLNVREYRCAVVAELADAPA